MDIKIKSITKGFWINDNNNSVIRGVTIDFTNGVLSGVAHFYPHSKPWIYGNTFEYSNKINEVYEDDTTSHDEKQAILKEPRIKSDSIIEFVTPDIFKAIQKDKTVKSDLKGMELFQA